MYKLPTCSSTFLETDTGKIYKTYTSLLTSDMYTPSQTEYLQLTFKKVYCAAYCRHMGGSGVVSWDMAPCILEEVGSLMRSG